MPHDKHNVDVESDFLSGEYIARCDCGWTSEPQDTHDDAVREYFDHVDADL